MKSPLALSGTLPEIAVSFAAQATTEPQVSPQAMEPLAAAGLSMLPGSSAAWSRDLFSGDKPRR